MSSSLISRNVRIGTRRTSVRLEQEMWDALGEICRREGVTLNELCTDIAARQNARGFTSKLRVFIMSYFRGET